MNRYDIAVIGGGPGGLAATAFAHHVKLNTVLIAPDLGGKVNYRFALRNQEPIDTVWGADLVHQLAADIRTAVETPAAVEVPAAVGIRNSLVSESSVTHIPAKASRIQTLEDGLFAVELEGDATPVIARSVIITTGAEPQRLYIPGEWDYFQRGVSFSAVSHAPLAEGRRVAVVGGNRRAQIAVLALAQLAAEVYWIPTTPLSQPASLFHEITRNPKVTVFHDWGVERIVGDEFVTGIELVSSNRLARHVPVEMVFVLLGLVQNNELARDVVDFDPETGHIKVDQRCLTSRPGLFAAGDITNTYAEQVPVAIGEGIKAAISAWEYLVNAESGVRNAE